MKKFLPLLVLGACSAPGEPPPVDPAPSPRAGSALQPPTLRIPTVHYARPAGSLEKHRGAHCSRCNTRWGTEDLAAHQRHVDEEQLMMSTSCKLCRYHGAYKNMKFVPAAPRDRQPSGMQRRPPPIRSK